MLVTPRVPSYVVLKGEDCEYIYIEPQNVGLLLQSPIA